MGGEAIDFATEQVLLVTMGIQGTGGHSIVAESVKDAGDYVELNVLLRYSGADCITTQALSHPYQVLKIKSQKQVRTIERSVNENCT